MRFIITQIKRHFWCIWHILQEPIRLATLFFALFFFLFLSRCIFNGNLPFSFHDAMRVAWNDGDSVNDNTKYMTKANNLQFRPRCIALRFCCFFFKRFLVLNNVLCYQLQWHFINLSLPIKICLFELTSRIRDVERFCKYGLSSIAKAT